MGRRLPLEEIRQTAEEPPAELLADYRQRFGSKLSFARGEDCLVLNAAVLGLPIRRTATDARRFIAAAPGNLLVHYRDDASLITRIRTLLRTCAPEDWPDAVSLAEALGLAPATLRRQLAASGQTYQGLKDERRCRLACRQLDQGALPLDELALRLGFADPRSFQRALSQVDGPQPPRLSPTPDPGGLAVGQLGSDGGGIDHRAHLADASVLETIEDMFAEAYAPSVHRQPEQLAARRAIEIQLRGQPRRLDHQQMDGEVQIGNGGMIAFKHGLVARQSQGPPLCSTASST